MTTKSAVEDFVTQRSLAVVGVSRSSKKFGSAAAKALMAKGYKVFPINPNLERFEDGPCYPDLRTLPEKVGGVVVVVPPSETEKVVREAAEAGITRVWMQQGAESATAVRFCQEHNMSVVHGECILMFTNPVDSIHRVHRWLWGAFGKLPH